MMLPRFCQGEHKSLHGIALIVPLVSVGIAAVFAEHSVRRRILKDPVVHELALVIWRIELMLGCSEDAIDTSYLVVNVVTQLASK